MSSCLDLLHQAGRLGGAAARDAHSLLKPTPTRQGCTALWNKTWYLSLSIHLLLHHTHCSYFFLSKEQKSSFMRTSVD